MTKNKRKQKRHLKLSIKQLEKLIAAKQVETKQPAPASTPAPATTTLSNEYLEQIEQYNQQVAEKFGDKIKVLERYINPHAIIKHYCNECYKPFYAKPKWLLASEQPHDCLNGKRVSNKYTSQAKVTDQLIEEMIKLLGEGLSISAIARRLDLSRPTVIKYLRKAGAY